MEVKDTQSGKVVREASTQGAKVGLQRSVKSLSTSAAIVTESSTSSINIAVRPQVAANTETRARANKIINIVNVASDATAEISKLMKGIDGIVEQATAGKLPTPRKNILEDEANQLVKEIKNKASSASSDGVRPLAGDKIKLEIEEKLGKSLEFILPKNASEAFGLGQINFTAKDSIVSTRAKIEAAHQQVQELQKAVDSSKDAVHSVVDALEVAFQNSSSAEASLRDVDLAIKLASQTKIGIVENPDNALKSVGTLSKSALSLLK